MADTIPKVNGASHAGDRPGESTPLENLLAVSTIVLRQAVEFLEEHITADDQLSYRSKYMPGSTIGRPPFEMSNFPSSNLYFLPVDTPGKHLRHARDHFVLLAESVSPSDATASPPSVPALSYDARARNTPMETSREAAIDALNSCIEQLREVVPRMSMDQPVTLSAITPHVQVFHTSFGREVRKIIPVKANDLLTLNTVVVRSFACCSPLVHGMSPGMTGLPDRG